MLQAADRGRRARFSGQLTPGDSTAAWFRGLLLLSVLPGTRVKLAGQTRAIGAANPGRSVRLERARVTRERGFQANGR